MNLSRFTIGTHPDLIERGIGLQPEAFRDFHFNRRKPADR